MQPRITQPKARPFRIVAASATTRSRAGAAAGAAATRTPSSSRTAAGPRAAPDDAGWRVEVREETDQVKDGYTERRSSG